MAGEASPAIRRYGHRGYARSLLPRQRRRMDPGARSRPGHSVQGKLLVVARTEEGAAAARGEIGIAAPEDARARARMDPPVSERASREKQSAHPRIRVAADAGDAAERSGAGALHSARSAARV